MSQGKALSAITVHDVFEEFVHGDDALRHAFSAWLAEEPNLSATSMGIDLAAHRAFYEERMKSASVVRLHRVIAVPPAHWRSEEETISVGRHWSLSPDKCLVMTGGLVPDAREYRLTAEIDLSDPKNIDWPATIAAREAFQDQEDEIILERGRSLRLVAIEDLNDGRKITPPSKVTSDGPYRDAIRSFVPCIHGEAGARLYDDGRIHGAVNEFEEADGRKGIVIHEWTSHHPGNGHTTEALSWLRGRYELIVANGIGSIDHDGIGDISVCYWERMRDKGLVDVLILDNGTELTLMPSPTP